MNRREFLGNSIFSGLTMMGLAGGGLGIITRAYAAQSPAGNKKRKRPNIIFFFTDDQGWGDMGAYGHPVLKTPNMDRLAAESCKFTNFYVTAPVCSPSRAGAMTGRIQNRFGMTSIINAKAICPTTKDFMVNVPVFHHVPVDEPMLPRQLQKAGYCTGHVGKWHLSLIGRHKTEPTPFDYGFDFWSTNRGSGEDGQIGKSLLPKERHLWPGKFIDEGIRFIKEANDQPFYLNVWTLAPHGPHDYCPKRYRQMYSDRTPEEQVYFGCVTQLDEEMGRLLKYLDETGLSENTIFIFVSDNGPESAIVPWGPTSRGRTPFRGNKHLLYEGGIRVPGIVRWPGVTKAGSVCDIPVSTLDLFPTLCAAAGAALPDDPEKPLDGGDFRQAIQGKPVKRPHPLYWQYELSLSHKFIGAVISPPLAMRDGHWKIMSDRSFENIELYNLDIDPCEHWNLAKQHPKIAKRMFKQLKSLFEEVNGPYSQRAKYYNPNIKDPSLLPHSDSR